MRFSGLTFAVPFSLSVFQAAFTSSSDKMAHADTLGFSLTDRVPPGEDSILVLDERTLEPLAGAQVSVSETVPGAFSVVPLGDFVTHSGGSATLTPETSSSGLRTLTVAHEGYGALSLVGVQSRHVTVLLKPLPASSRQVLAHGTTTGWTPRRISGRVYLGAVFPSLGAASLIGFNLNQLISPLKDQIHIWGSRDIPSNLVLPDQEIPVFLRRFRVNKPEYRLPVDVGTDGQLIVLQGESTVDAMKDIGSGGGFSLSALNRVHFTRLGLGEFPASASDFNLDLEAQLDLTPRYLVSVGTPPFKADVVLASVADWLGDRSQLIPMDIKVARTDPRIAAPIKPVELKAVSEPLGQGTLLAAIAVGAQNKRLSGQLLPAQERQLKAGDFLPVAELKDFPALPAVVRLPVANQGVSVATFRETPKRPQDPPSSAPILWTVITLPAAGEVPVPTAAAPVPALGRNTGSYSLLSLRFTEGSFDEREVDGTAIFSRLEKFTQTTAQLLKNRGNDSPGQGNDHR